MYAGYTISTNVHKIAKQEVILIERKEAFLRLFDYFNDSRYVLSRGHRLKFSGKVSYGLKTMIDLPLFGKVVLESLLVRGNPKPCVVMVIDADQAKKVKIIESKMTMWRRRHKEGNEVCFVCSPTREQYVKILNAFLG